VLGGWTLIGLAQALVWRISGRELIESDSVLNPTAVQMLAAAWTWAAITPLLVWLTRRLARPPARTVVVLAGHAFGMLLTAVVVTAVRVGTMRLLGLDPWAPRCEVETSSFGAVSARGPGSTRRVGRSSSAARSAR